MNTQVNRDAYHDSKDKMKNLQPNKTEIQPKSEPVQVDPHTERNPLDNPVPAPVLGKTDNILESRLGVKRQESEPDLTNFLKRISQELKAAQTTTYPPTVIRIADEIDQVIRDRNYMTKDEGRVAKREEQRVEQARIADHKKLTK